MESNNLNREESLLRVLQTILKDLRGPLATISGLSEQLENELGEIHQKMHAQNIGHAADDMLTTLNRANRMLNNNSAKPELHKRVVLRKHLLKNIEQMFSLISKSHTAVLNADVTIPEEFEIDDQALIQALEPIYKTAHELTSSSETLSLKLSQQTEHLFYLKITLLKRKTSEKENLIDVFNRNFQEQIDHIHTLDLISAFGSKLKISDLANDLEISFFVKAHKISNSSSSKLIEQKPNNFHSEARVLIVEDNSLNQLVTKLMVESFGCKVELALNGKQAIDLYTPEKYDCVFMDIEMPIMDGLEATQILRKKYGNNIPIIGLSADAMGGDMEKHKALGFSDYLIKPVKKETLGNKIYYWTVTAKQIAS